MVEYLKLYVKIPWDKVMRIAEQETGRAASRKEWADSFLAWLNAYVPEDNVENLIEELTGRKSVETLLKMPTGPWKN